MDYLINYSYATFFLLLILGAFGPSLPEEILLFSAGFFIAQGWMGWVGYFVIGALGLTLSDSFIYGLGRFGRVTLIQLPWLRRLFNPRKLVRIRQHYRKHPLGVFIVARWIYGIRPFCMVFAGLVRVPFPRFIGYNFLSMSVSLLLWGGLGYFLAPWFEVILHAELAWFHLLHVALVGTMVLLLIERGLYYYLGEKRFSWMHAAFWKKGLSFFLLCMGVQVAILLLKRYFHVG